MRIAEAAMNYGTCAMAENSPIPIFDHTTETSRSLRLRGPNSLIVGLSANFV